VAVPAQAQGLVGVPKGIAQVRHPRRGDRQRTTRRGSLSAGQADVHTKIQAEVELVLPAGEPLPRDRRQHG
jgi:hypothetical protein